MLQARGAAGSATSGTTHARSTHPLNVIPRRSGPLPVMPTILRFDGGHLSRRPIDPHTT